MSIRRLGPALAAACALVTFEAQAKEKEDPRLGPELRAPAGSAVRPGMLAQLPVGDGAAIGVGRFSVLDPPRPRTHVENERHPSDVGRRHRGIGGLGFRMNF